MNIVIVEDEPKTARLLKELVESYHSSHKVIAVCESIDQTISLVLKGTSIDLFFMDIQLADGSCFEIFKKVQINVPVIFCTAYIDFALAAFKYNGIDYILKPFKEEDIIKTFVKLYQLHKSSSFHLSDISVAVKEYNSTFLVRLIDRMLPIPVDEIAIIILEDTVVHLVTFKCEKYLIDKSINSIEELIDPYMFFRINRQMLVNRKSIAEIIPFFNRKIVLKLHIPVPTKPVVSRLKVANFLVWVEKQ